MKRHRHAEQDAEDLAELFKQIVELEESENVIKTKDELIESHCQRRSHHRAM